MTKKELENMIHANVDGILKGNVESLKSEIDAIIASVQSGTDYHKSLFDFHLSTVDAGVMATIQTLIDLGIVKISEEDR